MRESFLMTWSLKGLGGKTIRIRESNSTDVSFAGSKLYLGGLELEAKIRDPAFQSRFWGLNLVWMPAKCPKRKWKLGGLGGLNNLTIFTPPKFSSF